MRYALVLVMALAMSGCLWTAVGGPNQWETRHADFLEKYWEKKSPTKIQIVDGRVLHPSTGDPVNCTVMAPFEAYAQDLLSPTAPFRGWSWEVTAALGGWPATVFGLHRGHVRQGVAMSRACLELQSNTAQPGPLPAPDWCKAENVVWQGDRCVEKK